MFSLLTAGWASHDRKASEPEKPVSPYQFFQDTWRMKTGTSVKMEVVCKEKCWTKTRQNTTASPLLDFPSACISTAFSYPCQPHSSSFICRGCPNPAISTGHSSVDIGASANLEIMDKFCHLGNMLSVDGDADAAVEARIRIGWNKFRQLVPLLTNRIYH